MKFTIGKKLTISFLILALLVLSSGIVGIYVLNTVSRAGDTVAKEKMPILNAIMRANMGIEKTVNALADYVQSSAGFEQKKEDIFNQIDQLDMWISILEHGTGSQKFKKSPFFTTYQNLQLNVDVPESSEDLKKIIKQIDAESDLFKKASREVIEAHNNQIAYSFTDGQRTFGLPIYLLMLDKHRSNWIDTLQSAVDIVTPFEGNTDPAKGMLGEFLHTYTTEDEKLSTAIAKTEKYHKKLMAYADTINEKSDADWKTKYFRRAKGATARLKIYLERMKQYIEPVYEQLNTEKREKLAALSVSAGKMDTLFTTLVKGAEAEMDRALQNADRAKSKGTVFLIILTITAVLAAIVLGLFISRYMTRSITSLAEATRHIAAGDLQRKVAFLSNDELGDLAKDTNSMADNLREIIGQVTDFSKQLTISSTDLAGLAASMSGGARNMTAKSESVAAAAEEMSVNINSVAASTEEASTNVNTVSIAVDEMNSSVNEIAKNTEQGNTITQEAVEKSGKATERVNELGLAAEEISKITEVISEISEQTNLLALNATIEAARAGEAGKGFAVVASEIKELANQTAEATSDIRQRIEGIQSSTAGTVQEIKDVSKIIGNINDIVGTIAGAVEEQSATTRDIAENMGQASAGLQEVNENVAQSSSVANEIAREIGEVNTSSRAVLNESDQVNNSSEELKKLADALQKLVGQFKL